MAWPPPPLPTSTANTTPGFDVHPALHNDANMAVNDTVARLQALETKYNPGGTINTAAPAVRSAAQINRQTAAGTTYSALDGVNGQSSDLDTASYTFLAGSWQTIASNKVTINTAGKPGLYIAAQASVIGSLKPGETLSVRVGYQFDGAAYVLMPVALQGQAYNALSPGTLEYQVTTMLWWLWVPSTVNLVECRAYGYASGGNIESDFSSIAATPFWR